MQYSNRSPAIFTMVMDDTDRLYYWLRYYIPRLGGQNVYVLAQSDYDTAWKHCSELGAHCLSVPHPEYDIYYKMSVVHDFHQRLHQTRDTVVFCDCDEFLVRPGERLRDYLISLKKGTVYKPKGYDILHLPEEPALDWGSPWLEQRSWCHRSLYFDKPVITTTPVEWEPGCHELASAHEVEESSLLLLHTHRIDYEECRERHRRVRSLPQGAQAQKDGHSHHYCDDDESFEQFFYSLQSTPQKKATPQKIPRHWCAF